VATGEVSRKGDISELTKRTRFFVGNIVVRVVSKETVYKSITKILEIKTIRG
jgi:hypothetical protein